MSNADSSRPRLPRYASAPLLERLQRGPASVEQLTELIYGDTNRETTKRLNHLVSDLRREGHIIALDSDIYELLSGGRSEPPPQKQRTPEAAVNMTLRSRGVRTPCDCGLRPVTHVALFRQLTAECIYEFINALPICSVCAADFIDAEKILTLEDAYAMARLPMPVVQPDPVASGPTPRKRRPAPRKNCVTDGADRPRNGASHQRTANGLPWFTGDSKARTR